MGDSQINVDLTTIPIPEEPHDDWQSEERRAWILNRVQELGHPSLLDHEKMKEKFDVSLRQTYYDLEHVMDWVEDNVISEHHTGKNWTVFEKAKREALKEGKWQEAVEIVEAEAQWLEDRGHIDKEPEKHEVTWRDYVEE